MPLPPSRQSARTMHCDTPARQTPRRNPAAVHGASRTASVEARRTGVEDSPPQTPPPSALRPQSQKYPFTLSSTPPPEPPPAAHPPPHPSAYASSTRSRTTDSHSAPAPDTTSPAAARQ